MRSGQRRETEMTSVRWALVPLLLFALAPGSEGAAAARKRPKARSKAAAPKATPAPLPANVKLAQIADERGGPLPGLSLTLQLPDIVSSEVAGQRVLVQKALDDRAASLLPPDADGARMEANTWGLMAGKDEKPSPLSVVVRLRSPSREASALKEVSGVLELFMPGRDPAAMTSIPDFLKSAGKPVADPALKANGVEITVVTKAVLDGDKKAAADRLRQKSIREGLKGEDLEEAVSRVYDDFPEGEKWTLLLKLKDPQGRIQQFSYVTDKGQEIPVTKSNERGYTGLFHGENVPGPGWTLRVRMRTDRTLARYSFQLTDVPLP